MTTTVDRVGSIETQGIQPVEAGERHGRPRELFWLWFASNFGILGVVYGGILVLFGINIWQALLVVVVAAVFSYGLVGLVSLAGPRHGQPTLAFSRKVFGERGNTGPAVVSWLTLVGWETVALVVATYALLDLAALAGLGQGRQTTLLALAINVALLAFLGVLGHATLVWTLRIVTVVFGLLTVLAAVFVGLEQDWAAMLAQPAGPWDTGAIAALTIVAAGTGLTWVNCGADFTRYLPASSSSRAIVGWTIAGALPAVLITIMLGFALASRTGALPENPVGLVREALPEWMAVPILLTAVVGLLAGAATALYSSGMSLLTLGLRVPRYVSVVVDGVLAFAAATYMLLFATDFVVSLQNFLQLATIGLVAWAGVVLVWLAGRDRQAPPAAAMVAWLAGVVAGVLFSSSPAFTGPLAVGIFAVSGLGYLVSLAVSAVLYWAALSVRGRTV